MPKTDEDLIGRCYTDHRDLRMGCPVMVVTGVTDCLSVPGVWVKPRDVPERASDRPVTMSEKPFWRNAARVRDLIEAYERYKR